MNQVWLTSEREVSGDPGRIDLGYRVDALFGTGLGRPLTGKAAEEKISELAKNMTYLELSTVPGYMDSFVAACFLPHTDISLFPSVQG